MQAVQECACCSRVCRQSVPAVPEYARRLCRLFKSVQAVGAGSPNICMPWVQAVPQCAGSICRLFWSVQSVPHCAGSGCRLCFFTECRLFQNGQGVGAGCRLCRQSVQAVPECAGTRFKLFQSVQAVGAAFSRVRW